VKRSGSEKGSKAGAEKGDYLLRNAYYLLVISEAESAGRRRGLLHQ